MVVKLRNPKPPATLIDGIELYVRDISDLLGRVAGCPLSSMPPLVQARILVELSGIKAAAERMLTMCIEHTTEDDI